MNKKTATKNILPCDNKTIAAIAGAFPAAIAIIRLSGKDSLALLQSVFSAKSALIPRKMTYGTVSAENITDTAMAVFYQAPHSYTGEDMAEIFIHGSAVVARCIMSALIKQGASEAERGEFTRRAFLHGKIDLSAAEGIVNLINAQTAAEAAAAYSLLGGGLKNRIIALQGMLQATLASLNAAIDYPEENLEQEAAVQIMPVLKNALGQIDALCESFTCGNQIKNGVRVSIIGGVNVGKSLLSNTLCGQNKSIVTDIPGTTRDAVESSFEYKGRRFVLTDTAGLRDTDDTVERMGIQKSLDAVKSCDIVLAVALSGSDFVFDGGLNINNLLDGGKTVIYVENKVDILPPSSRTDTLKVSALTGQGIDALLCRLYDAAVKRDGLVLTELRHYNALLEAKDALKNALISCGNVTADCISADIFCAYNSLGQITGTVGSEAVVDEIFSRFCVGK